MRIKLSIFYLFIASLIFFIFISTPFLTGFLSYFGNFDFRIYMMLDKIISVLILFIICLIVAIITRNKNFIFYQKNIYKTFFLALVSFLIIIIFSTIWEFIQKDESSIELIKHLGVGEGFKTDLWLIFSIVLFGPISEELAFRWLIYGLVKESFHLFLSKKISIFIALVISSLAFVSVHGAQEQSSQLGAIFVIGVILAISYEYSHSIFVPILTHSVNNAVALYGTMQNANVSFFSPSLYAIIIILPLIALLLTYFMQKIFLRFNHSYM